jgi:hypothetical protein
MTAMETLPTRWRLWQYSLRTLFVVTLVAGLGLGRLVIEIKRVQRQKETVAAIKQIPGTQVLVVFRNELDEKGRQIPKTKRPPPGLLATLLGEDFNSSVASVSIQGRGAKLALAHVLSLQDVEHLSISLADPKTLSGHWTEPPTAAQREWTADELKELGGLSKLRTLELGSVTLAHPGVKHFKRLEQLETLQLGRARMFGSAIKEWQRKLPD